MKVDERVNDEDCVPRSVFNQVIADRSAEMQRSHRLQMQKCEILQSNWKLIHRNRKLTDENVLLKQQIRDLEHNLAQRTATVDFH